MARKNTNSLSKLLMTIDELRAAAPAGTDVVAFLDALRIPHGGGLVSRAQVERALGSTDAVADPPAIDVLRRVLAHAKIDVVSTTFKRGWTVVIAAREPRRISFNPLDEEPSPYAAVELRVGVPVEAKLYLTSARHLSAAHFVVSGLDTARDDALFFFVSVEDKRVWVATRQVLVALEESCRTDTKRVGAKEGHTLVGVTPRNESRRALRLWFPVGKTAFDLEDQVRDERDVRIRDSDLDAWWYAAAIAST